MAVSAASTVNSAMSANTTSAEGWRGTGGAVGSVFSFQLSAMTPAAKLIGVGAKAVPFLGSVVSAIGAANDLWQTGANYQSCMAGHS
jgi:hypothetical protein